MRAPKYCGKRDCFQLVTGVTYCDAHRHNWQHATRTAKPEHRARRLRILNRDHHICQLQYDGICISQATICDHIIALGLGGADTDANCQAACRPCHNAKSSTEGHTARGHTPTPLTSTNRGVGGNPP